MKYRRSSPLFTNRTLLLLIFGIFLLGLTALNITVTNRQTLKTVASGPVCDDRCVHELDCCKAIKANDDPYECAWPDRGWCFPSTCAPYAGQKTQCGWYWRFHNANDNEYHIGTNTSEGYGCMIGASEESMVPICEYVNKPTPKPTSSKPSPTSPPNPTKSPKPTKPPKPTITLPPSPTPTSISIPVTVTPKPQVTNPPGLSPIIIYITATPEPQVPFSEQPLYISPTPIQNNNPVLSVIDTLKNFLESFLFSVNPVNDSSNSTVVPTGISEEEKGPPIWEKMFGGVKEFFTTIAP